jgi:hypothetical protein
MQLNDILSGVEDQERGRWFPLLHPVTGEATAVALLVAGPDSRVQANAMVAMTDELAEMADLEGRVSGKDRAEVHRRFLARCVLDWKATEAGEPIPFKFDRMMRLLGVAWVKAQADAFAGNRAVYYFPEVKADAAA